jgi:hypothetical protein
MRRKNDILWKGILEEVFDDLLRFVLPNPDQELDLKRPFEFLDKELDEISPAPTQTAQTRFVDKLVRVYRPNGEERWLLVHVEVQGQKDPGFARRMFTYYYRILDKYNHPITAISIFTGPEGNRMPNRYEDHCLGTSLTYQYNTLCITDYSAKELAESENPFAFVILAAKITLLKGKDLDDEMLAQKLLIVRLLYEKGIFSKEKIRAIMIFLHNYVLFQKSQTNSIFMEQVDQITGKRNTMGIEEQLAEIKAGEARKEGEEKVQTITRLFVENLLKGSDFSLEKIASMANVSLSFVKKVKMNLRSTKDI